MGLFTEDIRSPDDLFVHTVPDTERAENQIERLERVFRRHGLRPKAVDCPAVQGEPADRIGGVGQ